MSRPEFNSVRSESFDTLLARTAFSASIARNPGATFRYFCLRSWRTVVAPHSILDNPLRLSGERLCIVTQNEERCAIFAGRPQPLWRDSVWPIRVICVDKAWKLTTVKGIFDDVSISF